MLAAIRSARPTGLSSSRPKRGLACGTGPVSRDEIHLNAQGKTQFQQFVLDFVEGFFAEIAVLEHFAFALHGKLANGRDIGIVEAVGGTHGKLDFVDAHVEQLAQAGRFLVLDGGRSFLKVDLLVVIVDEYVQVMAQNGGSLSMASAGAMRPSVQTSRISLS